MQLKEIIVQTIKDNGPISFHDYMEMALYYPELGYYTSARDKIGFDGSDYYTSCHASALFGMMIGKQIEEMWELLGKGAFTIVEYGAGMGYLCRDILNYLQINEALHEQLHYYIIEKSAAIREKEKELLQGNKHVSWINCITDIAPVHGCILSNELLDNFAVHQVVMGNELMEVYVDYDGDFKETKRTAGYELHNYFEELNISLPKHYRTEVNIEATEWLRNVTANLEKGFVLTIDYGYHSGELYKDYRRKGTMVCYNKHTINTCPYKAIGQQDITTHVNFSALHHWGTKYGLQCSGYTDQTSFLLALGFNKAAMQLLAMAKERGTTTYKKVQNSINILLTGLSSKMKVLVQQKGLPATHLTGLQLSNLCNVAMLITEPAMAMH